MKTLITTLIALVLAGPVMASHFYEPAQPGHGITVQEVDGGFAAQWYFHDGDITRWVASDVCDYGEACPVWTVDANGFPAVGGELVEAGTITLFSDEDTLLVDYDLDIEEVVCGLLPGPLPPDCKDDDGNLDQSAVLVPGFEASGIIMMELLAE